MPITVTEKNLLDLLEEALPALDFASGGFNRDEVSGKVKFALKFAGRQLFLAVDFFH